MRSRINLSNASCTKVSDSESKADVASSNIKILGLSKTARAIAPDGKTAISASEDKTLKIWDTESGRELKTLTGHTNSVTAVAIAPDGKTAISGSWDNTSDMWDTESDTDSGDTLKIWDTESGTELRTLTGHTSSVTAVAIAPNSHIAVSASEDYTLKIWDLLSGKEVASFSGDYGFNCCAIAPDGVTVVAGDRSGRVHFLRLEGVKQLTVDS